MKICKDEKGKYFVEITVNKNIENYGEEPKRKQ